MSSPPPTTRDIVRGVFGPVKEYGTLAGQIPAEDYDYHHVFSGFRKRVREDGQTLVDVINGCTRLLPARRRVRMTAETSGAAGGAVVLSDAQRAAAMEAIDSLLENVDAALDEVRGRRLHAQEQLAVSFGAQSEEAGAVRSVLAGRDMIQVAHVLRPQIAFAMPVDNSAAPFVPVYYDSDGVRHTGEAGVHPFEELIKGFHVPAVQLLPSSETPPPAVQGTPLHFIDTEAGLQSTVQELLALPRSISGVNDDNYKDNSNSGSGNVAAIAVDLEHHDFYSYQGFTCLMQISTRTADYIVDCLRLRPHMHLLAPVFLHPSILKVFHGAREDVRWLQKDFGLYLVNFFDTGIALQTLHMPHSLAFAVDHFCQVRLDKKYQTADWRVRPLPAEMVSYARRDTHYLLYIYDRLKALLLNSESHSAVGNLLLYVYNESRRLSLEQYVKPELDEAQTYKLAFGRSLGGLSALQERVARELFNWRDAAARAADDSPTAVLHLSSVLAVASKLPTSASELMRCCSPMSAVVRAHVTDLLAIVRTAVAEAGLDVGETTAATKVELGVARQTLRGELAGLMSSHCVAVHRPMTGTLPSIESRVEAALCDASQGEAEAAARVHTLLTDTQASPWLRLMRELARGLGRRAVHHVPLPGAALAQRVAAAAAAEARTVVPLAAEARTSHVGGGVAAPGNAVDEDRHEESAQPGHVVEDEATLRACKPDAVAVKDEKDATAAEGAVSIRQTYGIETRRRRKVRRE